MRTGWLELRHPASLLLRLIGLLKPGRKNWRYRVADEVNEGLPSDKTARTYCGVGVGVVEVSSAAEDIAAPDAFASSSLRCHSRCKSSGLSCVWLDRMLLFLSARASAGSNDFRLSPRLSAFTCEASGTSARNSGGSCCILLSLSDLASAVLGICLGDCSSGRIVPVFAVAFSLSAKALSLASNVFSFSLKAVARASNSLFRCASCASAAESCLWQEQIIAKEMRIETRNIFFIRGRTVMDLAY